MLTSVYHSSILQCLREIPYIRRKTLFWLLRLKFQTSESQFARDLRVLEQTGMLVCHGEPAAFVSQISAKQDGALLSAADVMAEICGERLPEFLRGEPPCILSFYIRDERGYLDFKVVPVPPGKEQILSEQLFRHYGAFKCTWIFLLEDEEQLSCIHTKNQAFFVLRQKDGAYDYIKG